MNSCNNTCNTCTTSCTLNCPVCNTKGLSVPLIAVKTLVKDNSNLLENEKVYICQNKKCNVVYFQNNNPNLYFKENIKVNVWFKEKINKFVVCYCHNIYLQDVINVINNTNDEVYTKESILKYLKKEEKEDCLHNNPIGTCCDRVFFNAIEFALHQKKGEH